VAPKKQQRTRKQHYVPRCYLERFVNPTTGNLSTFDKLTKKTYDTSVWNVAQESFFYDLHPKAIKPEHRNAGIDLQAVEKALSVIEGYFARTLDVLLGGAEPTGIGKHRPRRKGRSPQPPADRTEPPPRFQQHL
jgi:uncharacterized protein DUF4238